MNSKNTKKAKAETKKRTFRGGRQILVVGLVALVLAAGYYRWTLGTVDSDAVSVSSTTAPSSETPTAEDANDAEKTFGFIGGDKNKDENQDENKDEKSTDEQQAEKPSDNGSSVITESRQDRDKLRGETMDKWKEISGNSNASETAKKEAEDNIVKLTEYSENENAIETGVKSKGFDDCFAQVSDSGVSVIVKGGNLDSATVAQIKDIIVAETGAAATQIKISAEQ